MGVKRQFWTDLWWLLLITFAGAISVISLVFVCSFMMGIPIDSMPLLHTMQWLQNLLMFAVPAIIWVKLVKKEYPCKTLRLGWCGWKPLALVALLMIVMSPLLDWFAMICQNLPLPTALEQYAQEQAAEQEFALRQLLSLDGVLGWIELISLMCVTTAIGEEMMFRGAIKRCFEPFENSSSTDDEWINGRKLLVALIVGLFFSICHLEVYGFIPRWFLGAGLMLLVYWSGSIWPSVLAHAMNNLFALIGMKDAIDNNYVKIEEAPTMVDLVGAPGILASAALSLAVIYWMGELRSAKE